jgi:hypothetical protein
MRKQYIADVIMANGKRTTVRRVEAVDIIEAISLFRQQLADGETLRQVKGGDKGSVDLTEQSDILNITR